MTNSGQAEFAPAKRRWSRKMRTSFEDTRYLAKASSCAKPETVIRSTGWLGGDKDTQKQDRLVKCDTNYGGDRGNRSRFFRNSGSAVRCTKAVEAFGVSLTARSGYSEDVTIQFDWRGPEGKKHYICGDNGKQRATPPAACTPAPRSSSNPMTEMTATSQRHRNRRKLAFAAAAVIAMLAVAAFLLIRSVGPSTDGPLENPEQTGMSLRQHPGDTIGYGVPVAWNVGEKPVKIQQVRLIDPDPGMQVVEAHAAGSKRRVLYVASTERWPSKDFTDLHPVGGYVVAPRATPEGDRGVEFVFALRFPKVGDVQHHGVEVRYTVDGDEQVAKLDTSLRICVVPESQPLQGPCDPPEDFQPSGT